MSFTIPFDNTYTSLPERLYSLRSATPVTDPCLIAYNTALAAILGIEPDEPDQMAAVFSGNRTPEGAEPLAQLYSGHQFGHWNPQLGDGRAVLLGEVVGTDRQRYDIQLKGAGRTPYSRGGDGRAWLGPVLREYVTSEAMYALGIPTTRALAAVTTGETVMREEPLPGAILTRVAKSHIRVGTFQVLAARQDIDGLQRVFDYTRARHYPQARTPAELLRMVGEAQTKLVAQWMAVGFIHGVMNTDNCLISGETIDYGPCAFMDAYNPMQVYSSIDRKGRYAFGRQPDIIVWNMAQFATALVALMQDVEAAIEEFTDIVQAMPKMFQTHWLDVFSAKIGISSPGDTDHKLISDLLDHMADEGTDFTNAFRALSRDRGSDAFTDQDRFAAWARDWRARIAHERAPSEVMQRANPAYIPRNHRIEQMIAAARQGDMTPFHRLIDVLSRPFDDQAHNSDLINPPTRAETVHSTFCGT